MWSIEDAFPVVHGRVVDAVSEHERTIFKGLDVACVNVGAPVCVWTHELELCCAKSGDVEVGPEGLDVSLVVDVHLSHVYEQMGTVADGAHGVDRVFRDVLGKGPGRACAVAVVTGVVDDFGAEKADVEIDLSFASLAEVPARLDFITEPVQFFLYLSQKVI